MIPSRAAFLIWEYCDPECVTVILEQVASVLLAGVGLGNRDGGRRRGRGTKLRKEVEKEQAGEDTWCSNREI